MKAITLSEAELRERLARVKVLITDADRNIASIVSDVLQSLGFKDIHTARDGSQALKLLKTHKVDMVITDWRMAPMNGIDLVKYLRTADDSPNRMLPVIMLTGNASREHVEEARDAGVTEFVVKPFTAKTLCNRITLLIEHPRSFIMSRHFTGPDRRRRGDSHDGKERRK